MLFIENKSLDPWFNIAAEEYFLKYLNKEIVMIWRSNPSIIVGKHQNTLAEVNLSYVIQNNIPVIRRLSGGGTVFHDPGNINFTFIREVNKDKIVDFEGHTRPIIKFLHSLGADARFEGKNDLRVNGLKISGNAEHVHRNKVLHHGTLLFDSNLDHLNEAIKAEEEKFDSKAIKSTRSKVANISDYIDSTVGRNEFIQQMKDFLFGYFTALEDYHLTGDDLRTIERLKEKKYTQWEWNYGYSPVYEFSNKLKTSDSEGLIKLRVKKGYIDSASIHLNPSCPPETSIIECSLKGIQHKPEEIELILEKYDFLGFNSLENKWQVLGLFF